MNDDQLAALASAGDENLAATWARIGAWTGSAFEDDGLAVRMASGLPMAFFNSAFCRRPTDPNEADTIVRAAIDFFGARNVPWLMWTRTNVDPELSDACARAGLREVGGPPAMVLPVIPHSAPELPANIRVARATGDDLETVQRILAEGFAMSIGVAEKLMSERVFFDAATEVLLGKVDDRPTSTALVHVTGPTAGIYNVATVPDAQGRGVGAAVTWAAVLAGRDLGADHATLQSSPTGYPVYSRMGFIDVGRYEQWEGPPTS